MKIAQKVMADGTFFFAKPFLLVQGKTQRHPSLHTTWGLVMATKIYRRNTCLLTEAATGSVL